MKDQNTTEARLDRLKAEREQLRVEIMDFQRPLRERERAAARLREISHQTASLLKAEPLPSIKRPRGSKKPRLLTTASFRAKMANNRALRTGAPEWGPGAAAVAAASDVSSRPLDQGSRLSFNAWPLPRWVLAAPRGEFPSAAKVVLAVFLGCADPTTGSINGWTIEDLSRMSGRSPAAVMRIVTLYLEDEGALRVYRCSTLPRSAARTLKKKPKNAYRFDQAAFQELDQDLVRIPADLAERGDLTADELLVFSWLLDRAAGEGVVNVTVAEVAAAVGLRQGSAARCLRVLDEKKLIQCTGDMVRVLSWD